MRSLRIRVTRALHGRRCRGDQTAARTNHDKSALKVLRPRPGRTDAKPASAQQQLDDPGERPTGRASPAGAAKRFRRGLRSAAKGWVGVHVHASAGSMPDLACVSGWGGPASASGPITRLIRRTETPTSRRLSSRDAITRPRPLDRRQLREVRCTRSRNQCAGQQKGGPGAGGGGEPPAPACASRDGAACQGHHRRAQAATARPPAH